MGKDIHNYRERMEELKDLLNSPNRFFEEDKPELRRFYKFLLANPSSNKLKILEGRFR